MRRIYTLLVVLATAVSSFGFVVDGIEYYTISEDSVEVYGLEDKSYSGSLVIPETVNYNGSTYIVGKIDSYCFEDCTGLTSVNIKARVKTIPYACFRGCTSLESVTMPKTVEAIYGEAFNNCTSLKTFNIPEAIMEVGAKAFANTAWWNSQPDGIVYKDKVLLGSKGSTTWNWDGVGHLDIQPGTRVIADQAQPGRFETITIPNSVVGIGAEAFKYCFNLKSIHIPASVTRIGTWLFGSCHSLESITVDSSNPVYDSRNNCNAIIETATNKLQEGCQNTVIPDGIEIIGNQAFRWCTSLTKITIPHSVTKVEGSAFLQTGIDTLVIPSSVVKMESQAFECNDYLKSLVVESGNPVFDSRDNCNAIIVTASDSLIFGCPTTVIPNSVTAIGSRAFHGIHWGYDKPFIIPSSVSYIGYDLFWEGSVETIRMMSEDLPKFGSLGTMNHGYTLDDVTLYVPLGSKEKYAAAEGWSNFTHIVEMAMDDDFFFDLQTDGTLAVSVNPASKKTAFKIPATKAGGDKELVVASISSNGFKDRATMTAVEIPASVDSIGNYAFRGCTALNSIVVDKDNKALDSRNNCNAVIVTASDSLIVGCKGTRIEGSVKHIGDRAFYECTGLESIDVPYGVKSIGSSAFDGCTNLSSVELNSSLKSIGNYAFYNCKKLGMLELPNSLESIGSSAFFGCAALPSITIPASVTKIGSRIVGNCESLNAISVEEGNTVFDSRQDCNAIIVTANDSLTSGCAATIIPNTVRYIGESAFSGCKRLSTIAIPNSVKSIGYDAFYNCTGAKSISIGNAVDSIAYGAFLYCDSLSTIVIPATTTFIGNYSFQCDGLEEVVSLIADTASCRVMRYAFSGLDLPKLTLKVPSGKEKQYREAPVWKEFGRIIGIDPYLYEPTIVTVNSYTREYGDENPQFEYNVEGGRLGGTPDILCEATDRSDVGEYPIRIERGGVENSNVAYYDGKLTVKKAPLTVSVADAEREIGTENPEFVVSYEGWKFEDTEDVLTQLPVVACVDGDGNDVGMETPAGEYAITASGGEAVNYEFIYKHGKLTIVDLSGIATMTADSYPQEVYTAAGVLVKRDATSANGLRKGLYIVGGRKVVVR